jgi:LmbE family N-acetylglucosaminyl deacetylase
MRPDFEPLLDKARPLFFNKLNLSSKLRVLVLAPHPDDFDAIGVTIRMLRDKGNKINLAVLTSGAGGVEDNPVNKLTRQEKAVLREEEQKASCNFFGLPAENLSFLHLDEDAEHHIEVSERNLERLKTFWDAHSPDIVFMPHGNDTNKEHKRTYMLFQKLMETESRSLAALLNKDPKTIAMKNDLYTTFDGEDAIWKAELLRCHKSQHERNLRTRGHGFDDRILNVNRQVAQEAGINEKYAEVFEIEWHPGNQL